MSPRTLASHLDAAAHDLRCALEPPSGPGERVLARIDEEIGHVVAVRALLSSDQARVRLGYYPAPVPREHRRALATLERRLRAARCGYGKFFSRMEGERSGRGRLKPEAGRPRLAERARLAEAALVCEALPAAFDRYFGRVVRGDRAGAKDRFVAAACEALNIKERTPGTLKRFCQRGRAAAKSRAVGGE